VVEGAPLLREYTSKAYRGFESLPLRHATDMVQVLNPARPVDAPPFACSRCGTADYMSVKVKTPSAGDYGHLTIRRLLRIRSVSEWGNRLLGDAPVSGKTPKRL
jgi:hypothetical protein